MSIRAQFDDGVTRLVYLKETVDRFIEQNKRLVARGAAFRQLSDDEKCNIIELARKRLSNRRQKLHVVARQIADETGRAIETVRYTLRRYDEAHPETALFVGDGLPMVEPGHKSIWKAHRSGDDVATIARTFERPIPEVRAVLREMQARKLKSEPARYVYHELFAAPDADEIILDAPRPAASPATRRVRAPRDLPAYLRSMYDIPLMTAEQEADAFRRYNYLKYKAAQAVDVIDVLDVGQSQIDEVLALRRQYVAIRKQIVRANLRLVVSIAKKHVGRSANFFEVVSDGNMSLLRAVEKFDFSRGFKFSTYASWAIMKNYARTIPGDHYQKTRYVTGQEELLDSAADTSSPSAPQFDDRTLADILKGCMNELTDRERHIVTAHFGLFGQDAPQTLEQLGDEYGVTKERIRQIERRAIGKIKERLSPNVVDWLPG